VLSFVQEKDNGQEKEKQQIKFEIRKREKKSLKDISCY
jgi:hypothetical protein